MNVIQMPNVTESRGDSKTMEQLIKFMVKKHGFSNVEAAIEMILKEASVEVVKASTQKKRKNADLIAKVQQAVK
jgi:hypothetical protein